MKKVNVDFLGFSFMITSTVIALVVGTTTNLKWIDSNSIVIYWFKLMVVILCSFAITHLVLYNFGNLARAIYFKMRGHSFFPLVLYPFCFNWYEHKLQVNFTLRYQVNFYDFLPNDVIEDSRREKTEDVQVIKEGLYVKQYSRLFLLLIATVCFGILHWPCIFISLFLFVEMLVFSYVYDRKFHGEQIKIRNIKSGHGIIYLIALRDFDLKNAIAPNDVEKLFDLYKVTENRNYILTGVKRMLINSAAMDTQEVPLLAENITNILLERPGELSLNPDEKELEVIMLVLANALLKNDIAMLNNMHNVFRGLQNEWGPYSVAWYNYFQWFIEIIEVSLGQKRSFSVKKQIIVYKKTDSIGYLPSAYSEKLKEVEKLVNTVIIHNCKVDK